MSLNLDSLLIQLQDKVTQKWHQFGAALGVEKEILDHCLSYPPEQSIVEMLDHWLRNCDLEKRNWREVARALRQIKYKELAKEIESVDKIGHHNDNHCTIYHNSIYMCDTDKVQGLNILIGLHVIFLLSVILLPITQNLMMFQVLCFNSQSQIQLMSVLHRYHLRKDMNLKIILKILNMEM